MKPDGAELIQFGPYCLDRLNARLLRDGRDVPLTPKAMDLLAHLATRPDRLVTKEELLSSVWPDVIVGDASVKVCIGELRKALGDDPRSPHYIETVHRRGYRFLASGLARVQDPTSPERPIAHLTTSSHSTAAAAARPEIVGRETELSVLSSVLDRAARGGRQIVFVTGDAGSGKTTLIDSLCRVALSHDVGGDSAWRVGVGHCFEQFGAGEPYMPVWEAITQLDNSRPTTPPTSRQPLRRPPVSIGANPDSQSAAMTPPRSTEPRATTDRVLRQFVEDLEARAAETPILLVLEDLHWSDYSTLDLLSALARRRNEARLVLVGTYRPGDASVAGHPLRGVAHELVAREQCREIALRPLEESHVRDYLQTRMPPDRVSGELVRRVYLRTHGHPLFLASLVEDLIERGQAAAYERGAPEGVEEIASALPVPENVCSMIQAQLERLSDEEQRVLESAAVAGVNFSAAAVAVTPGDDLVRSEHVCSDLAARHRFLQSDGVAEWPDGTIASRYHFMHELYRNVVYARIPAARCAALHRKLALRMEDGWSGSRDEIAPELAMHFELGREWLSAVHYLCRCAARATDHYAHREAVDYLKRARAAIARLPDEDRERHELGILMSLAVHLQVTDGFAAPSVQEVHDRAYALCRDGADTAAVFPVLWGIWLFKKVRSELVQARELAEKLLGMAERTRDTALLMQAHQAMSVTSLCRGEPLETCRQLRRMQLIYDAAAHSGNTQHYGQDPGVACLSFGAVTLWITGEVEEAKRIADESLTLARSIRQPSSLALALHFSAMLEQCLGDAAATERHAREAAALADWEGFSFWRAGAAILRGWATAAQGNFAEGIPMLRHGIRDWLATGSRTYHTYFLGLLTDALLRSGEAVDALTTVDEAIRLVGDLHEWLYAAELHRLKAKCLLRSGRPDAEAQARSALRHSISIARQQCASSFEKRAAADLSLLGGAEPTQVPSPRRPPPPSGARTGRDRHTRKASVPPSRRRA